MIASPFVCRCCGRSDRAPAFRLSHSCGPCWAEWEARIDAVQNLPAGFTSPSHPPAAEPRDKDCPGVPALPYPVPLTRPQFLTACAVELRRLQEVTQ